MHLFLIGFGEKDYKIEANGILYLSENHALIFSENEEYVKFKSKEVYGDEPEWIEKLPLGIAIHYRGW